jgi:dolichol-phosphate mannosyltransferase
MAAITGRTAFGDNEGQLPVSTEPPKPMSALSPASVSRISAEEIQIVPPAEPGWIIVPEAFHPDWKAISNGQQLELAKAYGGLLAVRTAGNASPIAITFRAPWLYFLAVWLCIGTWVCVTGILIADRFGLLSPAARAFLSRSEDKPLAITQQPSTGSTNPPLHPLLVIPTYNESSGVQQVLDRALASCGSLKILVIDDHSPDGTADRVRQHPEYDRRVNLIVRTGKLGLGSAYAEGFRWALARDFDACLEMDADLSHDPADIPRLLQALSDGADAVIGSRYLDGVRVMNWPQDRLFLSLGASKFVRFATGLPLTDATSGFKAIRSSALRTLDWSLFKAQGYGFQVELHYFLWKCGARLVEIPIVFTERREGSTKMTTRIAAEALRRVLQIAISGK